MLGGFHSFGAGGYADTPLAKVLPVGMDRLERQRPDEPIRTDLYWPGPLQMQPTLAGLMHFALRLAGRTGKRTRRLGRSCRRWKGRTSSAEFRPGAVVLADAGEDKPLLGRAELRRRPRDGLRRRFHLALVDARFRGRHKRFWRQIVLWLAKKDEAQEGNVWVKLEQRRFAPGSGSSSPSAARDPTGEPLATPSSRPRSFCPTAPAGRCSLVRQDDQMAGSFRDTQTPGDYAIEVTATQKGQEFGTARGRFLVFQQDLELDNASADAATMESLAAMTGGQSLAPEQLPELIEN